MSYCRIADRRAGLVATASPNGDGSDGVGRELHQYVRMENIVSTRGMVNTEYSSNEPEPARGAHSVARAFDLH